LTLRIYCFITYISNPKDSLVGLKHPMKLYRCEALAKLQLFSYKVKSVKCFR